MPREKVKIRKRNKNENENENGQVVLFFLFWLAVLIECVALYKREYILYGFSRIFVVPILLTRVVLSQVARKVSVYAYLFLLFSLLSDLLTIFGSSSIVYVGLSLYTASYITIGCYFQQLKENHNNCHIIFIVTSVLLGAICFLWHYSPELRGKTFYIQIAFHCAVLVYVVYGTVKKYRKIEREIANVFVSAVAIIVITNILYGLDVLYFQRKYAIVDALVGVGNGMYLFLITRGALKESERC